MLVTEVVVRIRQMTVQIPSSLCPLFLHVLHYCLTSQLQSHESLCIYDNDIALPIDPKDLYLTDRTLTDDQHLCIKLY